MPLSLVNARSLQLECTVLHESLLMPVLTYSSEAMIWKWRGLGLGLYRDDLRSLLGIRRLDKVLNAWIRQFCMVMEGVDEKIEEDVLW